MKKIRGSDINGTMLSVVFSTKEIKRLSKLSDSLLSGHPNYDASIRLDHIKENNLTIYRSLFKKQATSKKRLIKSKVISRKKAAVDE